MKSMAVGCKTWTIEPAARVGPERREPRRKCERFYGARSSAGRGSRAHTTPAPHRGGFAGQGPAVDCRRAGLRRHPSGVAEAEVNCTGRAGERAVEPGEKWGEDSEPHDPIP